MALPEIQPKDLQFRFQLNKQLPAQITIQNPSTTARMGFKVKTTTPKKYVVRPSSGICEPGDRVTVQVIMQAQKEFPSDLKNCKDKFLVQTVLLQPGEELSADTFKKETHRDLVDSKLRVLLDGPPAPPSPVPEVSETEEREDSRAQSLSEPPLASSAHGDASSTRLRSAMEDLSGVTEENRSLRQQVATLKAQLAEAQARADKAQYAAAVAAAPPAALAAELSRPGAAAGALQAAPARANIWLLLLVAIIAFLLGHFT